MQSPETDAPSYLTDLIIATYATTAIRSQSTRMFVVSSVEWEADPLESAPSLGTECKYCPPLK